MFFAYTSVVICFQISIFEPLNTADYVLGAFATTL